MVYEEVDLAPELAWRSPYGKKLIRLREGGARSLTARGKAGSTDITCRDLGSAAWGIYSNSQFFRFRFGVAAQYRNDLNGGGSQEVVVHRTRPEDDLSIFGGIVRDENTILTVIFSHRRAEDWIYEASLLMDGRKDYEPVRNLGTAKFGVEQADIYMAEPGEILAWINGSYLPWTQELSRVCQPHATLSEWVESDLDMGIRCAERTCANGVKVMANSALREHLASGATLETLRERLACTTCGRRRPRLAPF